MKLKLKKDWTLPHFFSYISIIVAVLIGINLVVQLLMFIITDSISELPINLKPSEAQQVEQINTETAIVYPSKVISGQLYLSSSESVPKGAIYTLWFAETAKWVLFIVILILSWKMFRAIAESQPFSEENYKRLFIIGWIFIAAELYGHVRGHYLARLLNDASISDSVQFISSAGGLVNLFLVGMLIIVIGYVFKEGHRIFEEQKLTV